MKFETLCLHGTKKDESFGAISYPIYMTSIFGFESFEHGEKLFRKEVDGFRYTRIGNPTTEAFEELMVTLENGEKAVAFASGMGAISSTLFTLLEKGDRILTHNRIYGGTHALFKEVMPGLGIDVVYIDERDPQNVRKAIDGSTKVVYVETPTNPNLDIIDIGKISKIASEMGAKTVVDNTFATPYLQNPLNLGADIVIHSATKYIGGHADCIGGVVVGGAEDAEKIRRRGLKNMGCAISPFNAWLLLRGLKTLPLRVEKSCENAKAVVDLLGNELSGEMERVYYPTLGEGREIAKRQMRDFGGVVSFEIRGGKKMAQRFLDRVKIITLSVSLGDCESLVEHPASMTHSTYTEKELKMAGIGPGLVRLSCGIEDKDDLIEDIREAFR